MTFIERVVDAIVVQGGDQPVFHPEEEPIDTDDAEVQHRLVDAIVAVGEEDEDGEAQINAIIAHIFDHIGERQQQRVERRIKFMIHPDRNTHGRAKDAF